MAVLDRSELQASPLADLHAIADQLGLEGFRRLRKAELIDAILGEIARGRTPVRGRVAEGDGAWRAPARGRPAPAGQRCDAQQAGEARPPRRRASASVRDRRGRARGSARRGALGASGRRRSRARRGPVKEERLAEGVVELLGNGSAFLRVNPPEASDEDVYISAAQVRRCELVSGDRVTGPLRTPRRSERYPSLVRVETINGVPAGEVSEGGRYDERPVAYPSERLALGRRGRRRSRRSSGSPPSAAARASSSPAPPAPARPRSCGACSARSPAARTWR